MNMIQSLQGKESGIQTYPSWCSCVSGSPLLDCWGGQHRFCWDWSASRDVCTHTHVCVVCKGWDVEQTSAAGLPLTIWEALRTVPTWRGLIYSNLLKCSVLAASPMWSCCTVSNFPLALLLLNFKGINSSLLKKKVCSLLNWSLSGCDEDNSWISLCLEHK